MNRSPWIATASGIALALIGARAAAPCHMPEHLRHIAPHLSAAQLAALSIGSEDLVEIPYRLTEAAPCVDGMADIYPCKNVDLVGHISLSGLGGGGGNDIWGWVDPVTEKEYALAGRTNGTAFVDISDPRNPVYLGNLPTADETSTWRDIKVYTGYAFIVADYAGDHGLQVFDLRRLRNVVNPPVTFTEDAHYAEFDRAHNIALNEETGFAYAVGSDTCNGGLHMVDIRNPLAPVFAGCVSGDGYTHDTQCVVYHGPDSRYHGREICFSSNEDTVTIHDVTDKANPVQLSRSPYSNAGYTHQGWLTENQAYFIHDDELDEAFFGHNTRTYVWDVADLRQPRLAGFHTAPEGFAIDHNQYVEGPYTYQSNYLRGLRILRLDDLESATLNEAAYFDTYPEGDGFDFGGTWSNYPYYPSGAVVVNDMNRGLFIVRPHLVNLATAGKCPGPVTLHADGLTPGASVAIFRGSGIGSDVIPAGPCAGTETALDGLKPQRLVTAAPDGKVDAQAVAPAGACGTYLQLLDLDSCRVSNVDRLP